jgi:hypothetical protein
MLPLLMILIGLCKREYRLAKRLSTQLLIAWLKKMGLENPVCRRSG